VRRDWSKPKLSDSAKAHATAEYHYQNAIKKIPLTVFSTPNLRTPCVAIAKIDVP
jgi:hypothetical protein